MGGEAGCRTGSGKGSGSIEDILRAEGREIFGEDLVAMEVLLHEQPLKVIDVDLHISKIPVGSKARYYKVARRLAAEHGYDGDDVDLTFNLVSSRRR